MEPKIKYGDIVRLKSDKNIIGKITIDNNPNGILEYIWYVLTLIFWKIYRMN